MTSGPPHVADHKLLSHQLAGEGIDLATAIENELIDMTLEVLLVH